MIPPRRIRARRSFYLPQQAVPPTPRLIPPIGLPLRVPKGKLMSMPTGIPLGVWRLGVLLVGMLGGLSACTSPESRQTDGPAYADSIAYYTQQLADEESSYAYVRRSFAYSQTDQPTAALRAAEAALALNPDSPAAYVQYGFLLYKLDRPQEAARAYTEAIRLDSTYAPAWLTRGSFAFERGDTLGAWFDLRMALYLDTTQILARHYLGVLHYYAGLAPEVGAAAHLDTAKLYFNAVLARSPRFADAYYARALTYQAEERYSRALDDYAATIAYDSSYAAAYANRGLLYHRLNQPDNACKVWAEGKARGLVYPDGESDSLYRIMCTE